MNRKEEEQLIKEIYEKAYRDCASYIIHHMHDEAMNPHQDEVVKDYILSTIKNIENHVIHGKAVSDPSPEGH